MCATPLAIFFFTFLPLFFNFAAMPLNVVITGAWELLSKRYDESCSPSALIVHNMDDIGEILFALKVGEEVTIDVLNHAALLSGSS